jgi:hypothetical protein
MTIILNKFGTTLTSRQAGREAYNAIRPLLSEVKSDENIEIDFVGVVTFSPSWADEFLTPMKDQFKDRMILKETDNPSVIATMELLDSIQNNDL